MLTGQRPDAIDPRFVFRLYAALAMAGGFSAFVTLAVERFGLSNSPAWTSPIALAGVLSWAFASYSAALSRVEDPASQLSGLKEFVVAHFVIGIFLWSVGQHVERLSQGLQQ